MEGPSLFIAEENLNPFERKIILKVEGNTKVGKERLLKKEVKHIFSWGKHLVFQFDDFAMRIHFMLYGTYVARVNGRLVNGEYTREGKLIRLGLTFDNGFINMYNCSIKLLETAKAKKAYDFSANIMSKTWNSDSALEKIKQYPNEEIADVLLDQEIFAGVGNIIKNEVLYIVRVDPRTLVKNLTEEKLKEIIEESQKYAHNFYKWRKKYELRKHYQVYRQSVCKNCGTRVTRKKTGRRERYSFICITEQS